MGSLWASLAQGSEQSFYDLLNISPTASLREIKKAYREAAKKFHPDTAAQPALGEEKAAS